MTAKELHDLVEPIREAMTKDGTWPKREGNPLQYCSDRWWWVERFIPCETEDAHNTLVIALLVWALEQSLCAMKSNGEYRVYKSSYGLAEDTPIEALIAAYRYEKGIK